MKKLFFLSIAFFATISVANAQTTAITAKPAVPKMVDKNIKKLEKKASKAETLTERDPLPEDQKEEQAKPNPMKAKGADKSLNPQPFPPADKNSVKVQAPKTKNQNR